MCANYVPVTQAERLLEFFGVQYAEGRPEGDVFPSGLAPFVRLAPPGEGPTQNLRAVENGIFRFVPDFVAKVDWARKTYNARSETVHSKPTYREAWRHGSRCIIPAEAIYEPKYEQDDGSPVRWRISLGTGEPMGIAGIYTAWTSPDGEVMFGMSMLTVNADDHPFMRQFHAPGHEKRMVVILDPNDFDDWLRCSVAEAKTRYCKQWTGPLVGEPAPLPSRGKRGGPTQQAPKPKLPPPAMPTTGDLF
jgi:putative SOS response-associated peptidase YedK